MEAHNEEFGPVDIVVIGYPADAPMTGEAIPIVMDLVERGIVRIRRAVRHAEGGRDGLRLRGPGSEAGKAGDLKVFEGASTGLLGDEDSATRPRRSNPGARPS